jgi:hypothetical protein
MADVYVLGAGFSKAVYDQMPLLNELGHHLREIVPLPDEKEQATAFTDDVELWLTYLSQDHPWLQETGNLRNRAQFLDTPNGIRRIIGPVVHGAQREGFPNWLRDLICYWHRTRAAVSQGAARLHCARIRSGQTQPTEKAGDAEALRS